MPEQGGRNFFIVGILPGQSIPSNRLLRDRGRQRLGCRLNQVVVLPCLNRLKARRHSSEGLPRLRGAQHLRQFNIARRNSRSVQRDGARNRTRDSQRHRTIHQDQGTVRTKAHCGSHRSRATQLTIDDKSILSANRESILHRQGPRFRHFHCHYRQSASCQREVSAGESHALNRHATLRKRQRGRRCQRNFHCIVSARQSRCSSSANRPVPQGIPIRVHRWRPSVEVLGLKRITVFARASESGTIGQLKDHRGAAFNRHITSRQTGRRFIVGHKVLHGRAASRRYRRRRASREGHRTGTRHRDRTIAGNCRGNRARSPLVQYNLHCCASANRDIARAQCSLSTEQHLTSGDGRSRGIGVYARQFQHACAPLLQGRGPGLSLIAVTIVVGGGGSQNGINPQTRLVGHVNREGIIRVTRSLPNKSGLCRLVTAGTRQR